MERAVPAAVASGAAPVEAGCAVNADITFETKVWEQDYRQILTTRRMQPAIERNEHPFAKRVVYVNNVSDEADAMRRADRLVARDVIDEVVLVREHADDALGFFDLSEGDLGRGYVYSVSELVGLHRLSTDYLLHFSGDSVLVEPHDWLRSAVDLMEARDDVVVAKLSWTPDLAEVERESTESVPGFLLGYGFSDQMYLVRRRDFRQPILNEVNEASSRYPAYGGELFEKRVDVWMRNHGRLRATWTDGRYVHENIRRVGWSGHVRRVAGRTARKVSSRGSR